MSRPNTRPNNKDKHPGRVDLSPQRRTQSQKRADDEKSMEEKQAREEHHKAGVRQIAEVEECTTQRLKALMAQGAGPQLVDKRVHGGSVTASSTAAVTRGGMGKHIHIQLMNQRHTD